MLCFGEALVDRLAAGPGDPGPHAEDRLGAAPANVACGLARLGTPVAFLGRVGSDAIGSAFAALFADQAVEAAPLRQAFAALARQARWLLCGSLALASPASAAALEQLVAAALEQGLPLALDVNWRPTFWGLSPQAPPPGCSTVSSGGRGCGASRPPTRRSSPASPAPAAPWSAAAPAPSIPSLSRRRCGGFSPRRRTGCRWRLEWSASERCGPE